jgi:hypothetical protein
VCKGVKALEGFERLFEVSLAGSTQSKRLYIGLALRRRRLDEA